MIPHGNLAEHCGGDQKRRLTGVVGFAAGGSDLYWLRLTRLRGGGTLRAAAGSAAR